MFIVTHHGKAHMDDFLSCCLVIAQLPEITKICRRDPTSEEFDTSYCFILDIGGRLQPDYHNFDHHQLPPEQVECTFSLLTKYFQLEEEFKVLPWYNQLTILDSQGPAKAAQALGLESLPTGLISPIDTVLKQQFEQCNSIQKGNILFNVMELIGQLLIKNVLNYKTLVKQTKELLSVFYLGQYQGLLLAHKDTSVLNQIQKKDYPEAVFSVSYSQRNDGYVFYRFNDNTLVDFRRSTGDKRIAFIHSNGFMAQTHERLPLNEVFQLLTQALGGAI